MAKRGRKAKDLVSDEFKNAIASAPDDELKSKIVNLSKNEEDVLKTRFEDSQLNDAKELAKELNAPYAESLKEIKARRRYVLKVLQERGK
jgi:hypothetical protein